MEGQEGGRGDAVSSPPSAPAPLHPSLCACQRVKTWRRQSKANQCTALQEHVDAVFAPSSSSLRSHALVRNTRHVNARQIPLEGAYSMKAVHLDGVKEGGALPRRRIELRIC